MKLNKNKNDILQKLCRQKFEAAVVDVDTQHIHIKAEKKREKERNTEIFLLIQKNSKEFYLVLYKCLQEKVSENNNANSSLWNIECGFEEQNEFRCSSDDWKR